MQLWLGQSKACYFVVDVSVQEYTMVREYLFIEVNPVSESSHYPPPTTSLNNIASWFSMRMGTICELQLRVKALPR